MFDDDVVWAFPFLDGEQRHHVPSEQCLFLPPLIECIKAPWTRANHLGNIKGGDLPGYDWILPHFHFIQQPKDCVLRIRYNISSNDYPNIQQTFPSLEYDFWPTSVAVTQTDLVHFQWEGSNSQPKNSAGEGKDQTDRSGIRSQNNLAGEEAPISNP